MKSKINRSTESERSAAEILDYLQGDDATRTRRHDAVVSLSPDGDLLFCNIACGIDDDETVLIERLESDSMGDGWGNGWGSATVEDVIAWLEDNCEI